MAAQIILTDTGNKILELQQHAQKCMEDQVLPKVDLASKFYQKALALIPQDFSQQVQQQASQQSWVNVKESEQLQKDLVEQIQLVQGVLDKFGELCCHEFGDPSQAGQALQQSIELDQIVIGMQQQNMNKKSLLSASSASKYLYFGQISEGQQALSLYEQGLQILVTQQQSDSTSTSTQVVADICQTYCAIAELYMTDLCDEKKAQSECERVLELAHTADPNSVEVLTSLATYNKVINQVDKAKTFANQAIQRVQQINEAALKIDSNQTTQIVPVLPELQINLVRTMLDLKMHNECSQLLSKLLEEDEEDVQLWYLLALVHLKWGQKFTDVDVSQEKDNGQCPEDQRLVQATCDEENFESCMECFQKAFDLCEKYPQQQQVWEQNLSQLKCEIDAVAASQGSEGAGTGVQAQTQIGGG